MKKNPHIGESFEDFLRDEGTYDAVAATAINRTVALQIELEDDRRNSEGQNAAQSAAWSAMRRSNT
jgi:antitoxin HicB